MRFQVFGQELRVIYRKYRHLVIQIFPLAKQEGKMLKQWRKWQRLKKQRERDKFNSLDEGDFKVGDILPAGLIKVKFDDYVLLIKLAVSDPPLVLYSI